ncbi:McrB family protein [Sphingobacterium anhuiense]|uniref:McrB family protein n=1 Tax=Sphingobacterium anhuiense TaxID=493780 RepID=A0ABW5YQ33_9SPHI
MLSYKEFEKVVFDWLYTKHQLDKTFTFNVRKKKGTNSEKDYFIGTERSNYFATSFYAMPVSFPGSSAEAISLVFTLNESVYTYNFDFTQTQQPSDPQNQSVLNVIKDLKDPLQQKFLFKQKVNEQNKMFRMLIAPIQENYISLEAMFSDIDQQLTQIIELVDVAILKEKENNPMFKAHRVQLSEFENRISRMENRIEAHTSKNTSNESITLPEKTQINMPLNQILYGPPGTGKTYNTVNKAISIINPSFDLTQDRSIIKAEYNRLLEAGQIVFTTFHQSMSYEDFVEGIKPLKPVPSDTFVKYDVQPGIFRNICKAAETNITLNLSINRLKKPFEEVFDKLKLDWEDDNTIAFPLKTAGYDYSIIGFTNTSIQFKKASGGTGHTLSIKTLEDLYYGKEYDFKAGVGIYYPAILNRLQTYNDLKVERGVNKVAQEQNYVLIIDEINRGNVSAIFGELITLIEESKRSGKYEALEVTLPYSKETLSVPSNLYIIGTMNTADRSVEALDTALRRRFAFTELMPDPILIRTDGALKDCEGILKTDEGQLIDLASILTLINMRIVALLDVNHQIGHSYFINVKTLEDLASAFKNCIVPLLQEYFYHDEEKIALVLGEGFISVDNKDIQADELFPSLSFVNRLPNLKPTYQFNEIKADTIVEAVNKLLR